MEGLARGGAGGGWCCVPGGPELTGLAAWGKSGEQCHRVISTRLSVTPLLRENLHGPNFFFFFREAVSPSGKKSGAEKWGGDSIFQLSLPHVLLVLAKLLPPCCLRSMFSSLFTCCGSPSLLSALCASKWHHAACPGGATSCCFVPGAIRGLWRRGGSKELLFSPSVQCPQIPPVVLFGAGLSVSERPSRSGRCAAGTEPRWP